MPSVSPDPSLRKARSVFDLSPRLGSDSSSNDGFFTWRRWYGASSSPKPAEPAQKLPQTAEDVSRLVREALRRRREADEDRASLSSSRASTTSSSFSRLTTSDRAGWTDSPASTSATWETSASESSAAGAELSGKAAAPRLLRTSGYDQADLDALPTLAYEPASAASCPSPRLRAAQSVATLKAPKLLRRVSSSASIAPVPVESHRAIPHDDASSVLSDYDAFRAGLPSALSPPSAFPPSPALSSSTSSFRSRLASSLRKSASSATLRNPLGLSLFSPAPPLPLDPPPLPPPPPPSASAAAVLRDLLLKHDAAADPSAEPLSPLFDPHLARRRRGRSESDEGDAFPYGADEEEEGEPTLLFQSEQAPYEPTVEQEYRLYDSDAEREEDDPFRPGLPSSTYVSRAVPLAWMAPPSPDRAAFALEQDESPLDSPSAAFPPFDPFAAILPPPPQPIFGQQQQQKQQRGGARPRGARVITKQRSFVDPRTRKLRTAPTVCVTPSTPEKGRFVGRVASGVDWEADE
ncbi:hypothetical protein Rhopal_006320-T1 [Rhodotorula paludigena]|uniref:Proteophosphoglycan ppg4 n=1 Tax=Rhodotorula paludigena TaxID=86838 RepID=A0AAV5GSR3_9BASI|nr:hypothetical protein Rhopal_006320-T1 [Rhodotorula paludigena]